MKAFLCCFTCFLFLLCSSLQAQIISPSGEEVQYSYQAQFLLLSNADASKAAYAHAQHLFGIFKAREFVVSHGLDPDLVEGIGAPRAQMKISIVDVSPPDDNGYSIVTYRNSGKMLLHQSVSNRLLLESPILTVPMPYDLSKIYDKNCTDEVFDSAEDYWYYFNIFKTDCEYLQEMPYSKPVQIHTTPYFPKVSHSPSLQSLRGDNGNDDLFLIYIIHGFAESERDRRDDGRVGFKLLNTYFLEQNFTRQVLSNKFTKPLHLYRKTIKLKNNRSIRVEIRHLLVETDIEVKQVDFAKFFKEAAENADVVIYNGHSGLGANLDMSKLEKKVGKIEFKNKKQIFFFDSCSSYSYYLEPFANEKSKSKIDVITNGLASFFDTGHLITMNFLDILFDPHIEDMPWLLILQKMQEPLGRGGSYLINVGGL